MKEQIGKPENCRDEQVGITYFNKEPGAVTKTSSLEVDTVRAESGN
jgi:hypothetical protein